jgi:hypothetical protein
VSPGPAMLILYEDHYCNELHPLIKALRRDAGLSGILESKAVDGTGNFGRGVPKWLRLPLAGTRRPPDRVICVGDADRPRSLYPNARSAPTEAQGLDGWARELEDGWRGHLIERNAEGVLTAEAASRLRTIVLRWNKESLLIACPDALRDYAHVFNRRAELEALLAGCEPSPLELGSDGFIHEFRRPDACMERVIRAIHGRAYKKGVDDDDILRRCIRVDPTWRQQVADRCPDLRRLVAALA